MSKITKGHCPVIAQNDYKTSHLTKPIASARLMSHRDRTHRPNRADWKMKMTTTKTKTNAPFEMQTLAIYSHKCALIMRMVDVAVRTTPEACQNIVTTHGLNLTKEDADLHNARFDSQCVHIGCGSYEVILDIKRQESLGLWTSRKFFGGDWIRVYVAPKGGAL